MRNKYTRSRKALSVAALLAKSHELSGEWVIVSPVHWEAGHQDAVMTSRESATREQFDAFQAFVAEVGMELYYHDAETWLLNAKTVSLPDMPPLETVLNISMRPLLENLRKQPDWLRFLTEAQMFLSAYQMAHPDKTVINGVWLWGAIPDDVSQKITFWSRWKRLFWKKYEN